MYVLKSLRRDLDFKLNKPDGGLGYHFCPTSLGKYQCLKSGPKLRR